MPPKLNPTIHRDSSSSSESLLPPDLEDIESRRPLYHKLFHHDIPRNIQLPLSCLSIAVSAIQANGVYCWPTYGPVVAKMLELDGAEAQTIVVGGILGVYIMAAPLGAFTDRYGPRAGSLISGLLGGIGYLSFALLLKHATPETSYIHLYLTASFFCVGAATVGTYFACLTCASLSFPSYPTLSLSLPLSLLGLSSLFLSSFSTLSIFQSAQTHDLDPIKFLTFLSILCPLINLFSSIFMRIIPPLPPRIKLNDDTDSTDSDQWDAEAEYRMSTSQSLHLDERTPLLIGGIEAAYEEMEEMERGKDIRWTVMRMIKDWEGFWFFGIILALCIGPAETIIASIGSILTSLLPIPPLTFSILNTSPNALSLRNKHVQILSLTSTLSRLITGVLADYLCPPIEAIPAPPSTDPNAPTHLFIRKRPIRLNRSLFAAICSVILAGVYAWSAGLLETEAGLWVLSGGVGTFYGALFTLTPAIVSAHFGPTNFGLAWGMVSYFAALGSVLFSYLYAVLSVAAADQPSSYPTSGFTNLKSNEPVVICYGPNCFRLSFWVATACAVVSALGFVVISRKWRV